MSTAQHATAVIGVDLGDRFSHLCVLDVEGEVVEESRIPTSREGFERYFGVRLPTRVALEVGTHSPWVSRTVEELGHEVLVANARQLPLIYANDRKNDRTDAEILARVARLDPKLLVPRIVSTSLVSAASRSDRPKTHGACWTSRGQTSWSVPSPAGDGRCRTAQGRRRLRSAGAPLAGRTTCQRPASG